MSAPTGKRKVTRSTRRLGSARERSWKTSDLRAMRYVSGVPSWSGEGAGGDGLGCLVACGLVSDADFPAAPPSAQPARANAADANTARQAHATTARRTGPDLGGLFTGLLSEILPSAPGRAWKFRASYCRFPVLTNSSRGKCSLTPSERVSRRF